MRVLGDPVELEMDDIVVILGTNSEATVDETAPNKIEVTTDIESSSPVLVGVGEDITVSVSSASQSVITETAEGLYSVSSLETSLQPITVEIAGVKTEYLPGDDYMPAIIDIKPGSTENSINLGSRGNVPVAIMSTPAFDATTVDPLTVELASAPVKLKGKGKAMATVNDVNDVNGDGFDDLLVHIDTTAFELSDTAEDATLVGMTIDGIEIRGTDFVRIVPD